MLSRSGPSAHQRRPAGVGAGSAAWQRRTAPSADTGYARRNAAQFTAPPRCAGPPITRASERISDRFLFRHRRIPTEGAGRPTAGASRHVRREIRIRRTIRGSLTRVAWSERSADRRGRTRLVVPPCRSRILRASRDEPAASNRSDRWRGQRSVWGRSPVGGTRRRLDAGRRDDADDPTALTRKTHIWATSTAAISSISIFLAIARRPSLRGCFCRR